MSYRKRGHCSVSQVWSLPDRSNTHSSGLWSTVYSITSRDNGRWSTATGSKSSSNYWCGFPLWILLVLSRKPTKEAKRALKDLEQIGKELRFPRQGSIRAQVHWKWSKAETSSVPSGATHSETLSNVSRTPVSLHHRETNPRRHMGHSATPNGHDPTKSNEYFKWIFI